jgi:hypothetical protein
LYVKNTQITKSIEIQNYAAPLTLNEVQIGALPFLLVTIAYEHSSAKDLYSRHSLTLWLHPNSQGGDRNEYFTMAASGYCAYAFIRILLSICRQARACQA